MSEFEDFLAPCGMSIDPHDPHDLAFWTEVLDATPEELRQAVYYVGTGAQPVSRYLMLQRSHVHGRRHH